jgi:hypothetical protein
VVFTFRIIDGGGQPRTETYETAANALARLSELLSPPVNKPIVYVTNELDQAVSMEDLEILAIDEGGSA